MLFGNLKVGKGAPNDRSSDGSTVGSGSAGFNEVKLSGGYQHVL